MNKPWNIKIKICPGVYIVKATSSDDVQIQSIPENILMSTTLANEIDILRKKIEQREDFIQDVYYCLENSNSKTTVVSVLLNRCKNQINAQKLGVI